MSWSSLLRRLLRSAFAPKASWCEEEGICILPVFAQSLWHPSKCLAGFQNETAAAFAG